MRAARLHEYGHPLSLDEVPTPEPAEGEVILRVAGAGFCHSDLHVIDGELRILPRLPLTLGHENAGYVAKLGRGVEELREGDAVLVYGGWGCGRCDLCITGQEQLCERAEWVGLSQHDGGYAEYLRVPHARYLVPLARLDPREAAPLADAALTPYRAVRRALPFLQPDHAVLVIGFGGLGQYGTALLRLFSGAPVIVVDSSPTKLKLAKELGATHVLDAGQPELAKQIAELTGGRRVNASFDFVGSDATLALALAATRTGGKVTQVGLAGGSARMHVLDNVGFEVLFEATLWGTLKELREVAALAESGRLPLAPVELAPLDRINDVYRRLERGEVAGRVVITP